jgi:F-type H+-transporting ATPase subunit epsilon
MELEILTPKGLEFKDAVIRVTLPTKAGQITVLDHHAPLISVLGPGIMTIATIGGKIVEKEIEGGILEVANNKAEILLKKF